jgi:hypothetical protein
MRTARSLTLEQAVIAEVERTKGKKSTSERVNELLKRALIQEQYEELEREAERFFTAVPPGQRTETRAFQEASLRSIARD